MLFNKICHSCQEPWIYHPENYCLDEQHWQYYFKDNYHHNFEISEISVRLALDQWNDCPICGGKMLSKNKDMVNEDYLKCPNCKSYSVYIYNIKQNSSIIFCDYILTKKFLIKRKSTGTEFMPNNLGTIIHISEILSIKDCLNEDFIKILLFYS